MASQYKTRCPHCAAQFKITEEHLHQARGAVRCGSCLQVFQATDNLLPSSQQPSPPEDRWAGALEGIENTAPRDDELRFTDEPEEGESKISLEGMELSDSFLSLDQDDDGEGLGEDFADMQGAGRASHHEGADEAWAEALLKELENEPDPVTPEKGQAAAAEIAPVGDHPDDATSAKAQQPVADSRHTPPAQEHDDDDPLFAGLDLFDFDQQQEEPASFRAATTADSREHAPHQRNRGGLFKWSALSALALMVLVTQYSYFNFDQLARTPQWRPAFQHLCQVIGCRLPNLSDLGQLRGANLVVRSHPDYHNALVVDAILFNEARYRQPFPELELSFSALDGSPVAGRRFRAKDYLHGDLAGMDTMPIQTPLHISLEIVDPGEQAVNYNLRLLPAPESGQPPDA